MAEENWNVRKSLNHKPRMNANFSDVQWRRRDPAAVATLAEEDARRILRIGIRATD
jgi:hypothetical protein